jgi:hypothetical protein
MAHAGQRLASSAAELCSLLLRALDGSLEAHQDAVNVEQDRRYS